MTGSGLLKVYQLFNFLHLADWQIFHPGLLTSVVQNPMTFYLLSLFWPFTATFLIWVRGSSLPAQTLTAMNKRKYSDRTGLLRLNGQWK